jgi:ferredoxin
MPKKYHIGTKNTPLDFDYVVKFKITRSENCINCGKCIKVCIYEAFKRREDDPRQMADPNTVVCRNCFRCIQECPRGALEKSIDKDFVNIGGTHWKADNLISLWKQSEDGKVPVSGAGYRGPFTGIGFDSMWTDMSEIVRPTRDGIHGREYINTAVEIGRKLNHLTFNSEGRLVSKVPDTFTISIPILFDITAEKISPKVKEAVLNAAVEINTCVIMPIAEITAKFAKHSDNIIPYLTYKEIEKYNTLLKKSRLVEIEYNDTILKDVPGFIAKVKKINQAITIIRVPAAKGVEDIVAKLTHNGAEAIHIAADYRGQELNGNGKTNNRLLKDVIRAMHLKLVEDNIRDEVTLIVSGGIGMAEQVPKAMLCGADLTAIDIPLFIGLGLRIFEEPKKLLLWPENLEKITLPTITQRIVNLIGAWHSQILEMMGAMGIREARRLRGESGRAIFFEEIDKETFGKIFKKEKR